MFKVKDEVVYPGHGVAIVEEAVEQKVGGQTKLFFKLKFKYKAITILVPKERFENSGVRFVCKKEDVETALDELKNEVDQKAIEYSDNTSMGWSKRQRDYQLRIESGNLRDIARIYRDLRRYSEKKALSFGEKGILEAAEDLLSQEVLAATSLDKNEVLRKIRSPFEGFDPNSQQEEKQISF